MSVNSLPGWVGRGGIPYHTLGCTMVAIPPLGIYPTYTPWVHHGPPEPGHPGYRRPAESRVTALAQTLTELNISDAGVSVVAHSPPVSLLVDVEGRVPLP